MSVIYFIPIFVAIIDAYQELVSIHVVRVFRKQKGVYQHEH